MVSLRTSMAGLRRSPAFVPAAVLAVGIGLTVLAIGGRIWHALEDRHLPASAELIQFATSVQRGAPFDLGEANRAVYEGTTHSDNRRVTITESWLQWSLGKLYAPLSRTQNAYRLMAGALADCSERSQILRALVEASGHRCRFVGLDGHVVLEVETSGRWQVADPDYGVVYPVGIEALQQPAAVPLIRDTLASAGHQGPKVELYLDIVQSAENNVVLPIGSPLSPRLAVVEEWCDRLALPLPLSMIALGLVLRRRTRRWRATTAEYGRAVAIIPIACETGRRQPAA